MKVALKKALCVSILLGLSSAGLAQDWSGFYAGPQFSYNSVNTGWSFEQDQFYTVQDQSTSFSMNPSGFTMGAHLEVGLINSINGSWELRVLMTRDLFQIKRLAHFLICILMISLAQKSASCLQLRQK